MKDLLMSARSAPVMAVVILHIGIAYGLISGTAYKAAAWFIPPLQVKLLHERKVRQLETKEPPILPKLRPPPTVLIPLQEVIVDNPAPSRLVHTEKMVPGQEKSEPPPVVRNVAADEEPRGPVKDAWLDTRKCRLPDFPWQLKNREHDPVVLMLLVDVDGLVVDSKIEKSSGAALLDQAALDAFKICRYRPATAGETPIRKWKKLTVVWELGF
jgi:protein TonB